jgi:hypothetical protein
LRKLVQGKSGRFWGHREYSNYPRQPLDSRAAPKMRSGSAPPAPPIRSDRYKQGPFSHEFTADPQIPQIRLPGHHRITRNSLEEFALDPFPTDSSRQIPDLGTQRFDQKSTCPRHPLFPHTFGMILLSENPNFRAKNRAVTAGPKMTGFWTPKMRREREKKNRLACPPPPPPRPRPNNYQ